jgi:Protein of unknown function with HXXEE motif
MNFDAILITLDRLNFRQAIWLFPIVFALHVMEEAPHFTDWVQRYASSSYTATDFIRNNTAGMAIAIIACSIVWFYPRRVAVFWIFAIAISQTLVFNALFHIGTTAAFGAYSPGVITSLTLYPALFDYLSRLAYRQNLLRCQDGILSLAIAGVIHSIVVATQVFYIKLI